MIQGTGNVRAGQWSRSVCINENMYRGSMLPQIEWARANNIGILVMNPNVGESMSSHALAVWKQYVRDSNFGQVHIIAHSAGGSCLREI